MGPTLEDEVAFLCGVDASNHVAAVAAQTWNGNETAPGYVGKSGALKWGDSTPGTGAEVGYFFMTASGWTNSEKDAFRGGLELWTAVANITFKETGSADDANFVIRRGADLNAYVTFPPRGEQAVGSDTVTTPPAKGTLLSIDPKGYGFGPIGQDLAVLGGYPLSTIVHELGHAIGIGHGGPYNGGFDRMVQQYSAYDTSLWTLMSYISADDAAKYSSAYPVTGTKWDGYDPLTPMMLDILAVQRLYGVATDGPLTGGGHTFGFNSDIEGYIGRFYNFDINKHPVITLWENGRNNTFDVSKFDQDATINLNPGTFSSVGGLKNNVGIAFNTVIEKAVGGSGDDTITASDVASTLLGGGGSDKLYGGAGNDVLTGGADPDTFNPGSGLNILRDILSNMNGDTVFNFGLSTTIDIEKAAVGRNHLDVTHSGGDTTLGVGDTQVLLKGAFSGGEFMAVARGQGDAAHTMVTFETFLPEQGEGVRTDARAINGIANEPFMTGDGTVRFSTTLESASSTFANSLGVYKVAADGRIFDVDIVYADTLNVANRTVDLGAPANGVKLGFFLVQNGFGAYGGLPDNLSFVTAGTANPANLSDGVPLTLISATLGALTATAVFHSFQTLNMADAIQVLSGVAPGGKDLMVAFEDLPTETGDNDFQDVVIRIHTNHDDLFVV